MPNTPGVVPKKIRALALFLVLIGIGVGLAGYVKPDVLIPNFMADTVANQTISMMFTGRNLAMGIGMLIVVLWGVPEGFLLIFILRFLTEMADLIANIASASTIGSVLPLIIFICIMMALEAAAIMALWKIVQRKGRSMV